MGLRRWVRARRITTPPAVVPLVVLGIIGILLVWAALDGFGAAIALVVIAITGELDDLDDGVLARVLVGVALDLLVMVVMWRLMKRLVAAWVRRQPPDPPRAGPMNG